ncbi:hypothetical protein [Kitasatospora viridis]|uniref:Uncharacterized protein n=1 Tax=Kitasatospora viridis TaxID=281105 RepID=A0A561UM99_9ACTN|nr:hypothetical protein [Kitasatospora viridis]TWG00479.1 hypothetical protein FHX73_114358 [Kitasatospora viridis]
MSYGQPGVGGFAPVAAPPRARSGAAALPGLAVIMIMDLLLELGMLIYDLSKGGASYLQAGLWGNFGHVKFDAPVYFAPSDAATVVALIALIIGAFSGAAWVRPAGTTVLLVTAWTDASSIIYQLTANSDSRNHFASPVSPNLWLNLDTIAQLLLALVFAIVVGATMKSGSPAPYTGGFTPPPSAPNFPPQQGAPGFPPPSQGGFPPPPAQPPAQQPWGYPRPEAGGGSPRPEAGGGYPGR